MDDKFKDLLEDEELAALRLEALASKKRKLENADNASDSVPVLPINSIVSSTSESTSNTIPFVQTDRNSYNNYAWRKQNQSSRRRGGPFPKSNQRSNLIIISPVSLNDDKDSEDKLPTFLLPQHKLCISGNEDSMSPKTLRRTGPTRFNRHGSDSDSSDSDYENSDENDSGSNETVLQDEPPEHYSCLSPKDDGTDDNVEKQRRLSFQNLENEIQSDTFEKNETTSVYNCLKNSSSSLDYTKNNSDSFAQVQNLTDNRHDWNSSVSNEYNNYKKYNSGHSYSTKPLDSTDGFVNDQSSCVVNNGESQISDTSGLISQSSDPSLWQQSGVKGSNSYYSRDISNIHENSINHGLSDRKPRDYSDNRQSFQMSSEVQGSESSWKHGERVSLNNLYFSRDSTCNETAPRNYCEDNVNSKEKLLSGNDLRFELKKRMQEMHPKPTDHCNELLGNQSSDQSNLRDKNKHIYMYKDDRIGDVSHSNIYGSRQDLILTLRNRHDRSFSKERDEHGMNLNRRKHHRSLSRERSKRENSCSRDRSRSEYDFVSDRGRYNRSSSLDRNKYSLNSSQGRKRLERSSSRGRFECSTSRSRFERSCSRDRFERSSSRDRFQRSLSRGKNERSSSKTRLERSSSRVRSQRSSSRERSPHSSSRGRSPCSSSRGRNQRSSSRGRSQRSSSRGRSQRSSSRGRSQHSTSRERSKRSSSRERSKRSSSRGRSRHSSSRRSRRSSSRERHRSGKECSSTKGKITYESSVEDSSKLQQNLNQERKKQELSSSQERDKLDNIVVRRKSQQEQIFTDDKSQLKTGGGRYEHRYSPSRKEYARSCSRDRGKSNYKTSRNHSRSDRSSSRESRYERSSSSDSQRERSLSRDRSRRDYSSSEERNRHKRSQSRDRGGHRKSPNLERNRHTSSQDKNRHEQSLSHNKKNKHEHTSKKNGSGDDSSEIKNRHDQNLDGNKSPYKCSNNKGKNKLGIVSIEEKGKIECTSGQENVESSRNLQCKKSDSIRNSEKIRDNKKAEKIRSRSKEKFKSSKKVSQKSKKLANSEYENRYSRSRSSSDSRSSSSSSSSSHNLKPKIRSVPSVIKSFQPKNLDGDKKETFCEIKLTGKNVLTSQSDDNFVSRKDAIDFKLSNAKCSRIDGDSKASDNSKRVPVHMRLGVLPRKRLIQMPKDVEAAFVNSSSSSDDENVNTKCKRQNIRIVTDVYGSKSSGYNSETKHSGKEKPSKRSPDLLQEKSKRMKNHR